jgi:hypothetical protein
MGGLALAATHDPREYTRAARQALRDRFLAEQPLDLPEPERIRRAEAGRRLFYARLSLKSAQVRSKRRRPKDVVVNDPGEAFIGRLLEAGVGLREAKKITAELRSKRKPAA